MKINSSISIVLLLVISFVGLILVTVLAHSSVAMQNEHYLQKNLVGAAFSSICILGIFAGIFPSKCSAIFHFKTKTSKMHVGISADKPDSAKETLLLSGHHPSCGNFDAHRFQLGNTAFCSGCIGLIFGASLSLLIGAAYFFASLPFWLDGRLFFWIGFAGVTCGLLQYHLFNWGKSSVHTVVNAFFAFGVLLLLVGIDIMTQNAVLDFYVIALSVFWLFTRIFLSQYDHRNICASCLVEKCEFA